MWALLTIFYPLLCLPVLKQDAKSPICGRLMCPNVCTWKRRKMPEEQGVPSRPTVKAAQWGKKKEREKWNKIFCHLMWRFTSGSLTVSSTPLPLDPIKSAGQSSVIPQARPQVVLQVSLGDRKPPSQMDRRHDSSRLTPCSPQQASL